MPLREIGDDQRRRVLAELVRRVVKRGFAIDAIGKYPHQMIDSKRHEIDDLRSSAERYIKSGQLAEARHSLEKLVAQYPLDTRSWLDLADVISRQGGFRDCSRPLLQAAQNLPNDASQLVELTEWLVACGHAVEARACLDALLAHSTTESLAAQAHWRLVLGDFSEARDLLEKKIRQQQSSDPNDHYLYGMSLHFSGDMDMARSVWSEGLIRWPSFGHTVASLVELRKQTEEANLLQFVEEQLGELQGRENDSRDKLTRAQYEYARFKVLDDLNRPDEAWPALARSNALMRELHPYDPEAEDALVNAIVSKPDVFGRPSSRASRPNGPMPIFVVGMPRSGTTLLGRMLSSHSQIADAGELFDFWNQLHWVADERPTGPEGLRRIVERCEEIDFEEVGARYLEQTQWRARGRKFYIDKLPSNIQKVAFIRRALPGAPILHMVRDPMDVCFSNLRNFVVPAYGLESVEHKFRVYRRLCDHWRACAPDSMMDIVYSSLVTNPRSVMEQVLRQCGLEMEEACLHPERNLSPVGTPSSAQVREPIHNRSIGQWERYSSPLQPLREAIADIL